MRKWLQEGDSNTIFFHLTMKCRKRTNGIKGVWKNGSWLDDPKKVKEEIKTFFQQNYKEKVDVAIKLDGVFLKSLGVEDNVSLTRPFFEDEIKCAVWDCEVNQSPDLDCYNFHFIKAFF